MQQHPQTGDLDSKRLPLASCSRASNWALRRFLPAVAVSAILFAIVFVVWIRLTVRPPEAPSLALAEVQAPSETVRGQLHLDPFYQEYDNDEGLPILGSRKVSPYALIEHFAVC